MRNTVKLGDVLKTGAGGTPLKSKKDYYEGGSIKWLLSGAVCEKDIYDCKTHITQEGLANSSAKLFPKNTVLVAMYGATAGQVGILRTEAATNQAVCGIYPSKDYLPEFLYYYLSNYKDTLLLEVSGVAQPNLSQVKIKNIPLPCIPIAEQQRIVAKLDAAFAEIDAAIELSKKQAISASDYGYRIIKTTLAELSEQHGLSSLGNIAVIQPMKKLALAKLNEDDDVSFMGMDGLGIEEKYSQPKTIKKLSEVYKSYQYFEDNDVIFAKITPCFENGKLSIVKGSTNGVGFGSSEFVVLRTHATFQPEFLYYCLLDKVFRNNGADNMSGAVGHKRVTKEYFSNYTVPTPSLDVQQLISKKFDEVWKNTKSIVSAKHKKIEELTNLKSAILKQELQSEAA